MADPDQITETTNEELKELLAELKQRIIINKSLLEKLDSKLQAQLG